ncbi:MAG TPA: hypothetical protein VJU86_22040 [Pyrinomonadaceae bacterium]|nr:hypothetical protein [Pyrinomonadaceae bacterium]
MPGTWQALTHQPLFPMDFMLLLTDGTVLCHHYNDARWSRLTPDEHGEYLDADWFSVDPMHHARRAFGASVLADGRVLVVFGWPDISTGLPALGVTWFPDLTIELFDPTKPRGQQWSLRDAAPDWREGRAAQTRVCVLADRRVLIGSDAEFLRSIIFDPANNQWTSVEAMGGRDYEQHAWSLLPDGSVLAVNHHPSNFRYLPDATRGRWVPAGHGVFEDTYVRAEGAALLLPDGRVWVTGYFGVESNMYSPPAHLGERDTWTRGPRIPTAGLFPPAFAQLAGCLLPSGIVLFTGAPGEGGGGEFFEFDPFRAEDAISQIAPPESFEGLGGGLMLTLPTGQALVFSGSRMYIYTPLPETRGPQPDWRPRLTSPRFGSRLTQGREYTASGTLFNGMSQAVCKTPSTHLSQGVSGTNYPIIRLKQMETGRVWYCRTYGHSSMGVATGDALQRTRFAIPRLVPSGEAEICIIANGIAGDCVRVEIGPPNKPMKFEEVFYTVGNLADGPYIIFGPFGPVPVPPWPGSGIDKAVFKERILQAYGQILFGLLGLEALGRTEEQQQDWGIESADKRLTVLRQIEYGLGMLRKLGDELEDSLTEKTIENPPYGK